MNGVTAIKSNNIRSCFKLTRYNKLNAVTQLVVGIAVMCLTFPLSAVCVISHGAWLHKKEGTTLIDGVFCALILLGGAGFRLSHDAVNVIFYQ